MSEKNEMLTREMPIVMSGAGVPKTFDAESRSLSVLAATENPVRRYDVALGEYSEILLNSGFRSGKQIPLLDAHNRHNTAAVLGSVRDFKKTGSGIEAKVFFSDAEDVRASMQKVAEGHLTDFSVGYVIEQAKRIEKGKTRQIDGKTYDGPAIVATRWRAKELSLVPIGADPAAKARNDTENVQEKYDDQRARDFEKPPEKQKKENLQMDEEKQENGQTRTDEKPVQIDLDKERRDAAVAERARCSEIAAMCRKFSIPENDEKRMIDEGIGIDQARADILERLSENMKPVGHVVVAANDGARVEIDERDKVRDAVGDALEMRVGRMPEKPAPGATDIRGYSISEMAREMLRLSNQPTGGRRISMLQRAIATTDLSELFANTAGKSLFDGFQNEDETWRIWCDTETVSDFKTHTSVRLSEFADLSSVGENGIIPTSALANNGEDYSVSTKARRIALTMQALVNDDLGALSKLPMKMGEAAARSLGDVAYAVLTANGTMGDGTALFASGHGNLATSAGPVGVATLNAAEKAMLIQTDLLGARRTPVRPQYFIAPVTAKGSAGIFFASMTYSDSDTVATDSSLSATRKNVWHERLTQVYDPRLDDDSTTAWYLQGRKGTGVTVVFLEGYEAPQIESKDGWETWGIEWRVIQPSGAYATSWEGLYKNAGA